MLYAYPMDLYGVGHYRVLWPLAEIADTVPHRIVEPGGDGGLGARLHPHTRMPMSVKIPDDCSAVLMQRPTNEVLVACIPLIQAQGVPVLVDVDDDLSSLSARHPAFLHLHPRAAGRIPGHSAQATKRACAQADLVIASTPALAARYAPHGRSVVLRNRVRSDFGACLEKGFAQGCTDHPQTAPRVGPTPLIGWPGVIDSHPDDLLTLGNALARLSPRPDPLVILGPEPRYATGVPRRLGVPVHFCGTTQFDDWLPAIARTYAPDPTNPGIGLAPLDLTRFNEAKSAIKPLELATAGVPVVRATTPEYELLGIGLPATTPKQWRRAIAHLLAHPQEAHDLAQHDHEIAAANTYAAHREEWREVFESYTAKPPKTQEPQTS